MRRPLDLEFYTEGSKELLDTVAAKPVSDDRYEVNPAELWRVLDALNSTDRLEVRITGYPRAEDIPLPPAADQGVSDLADGRIHIVEDGQTVVITEYGAEKTAKLPRKSHQALSLLALHSERVVPYDSFYKHLWAHSAPSDELKIRLRTVLYETRKALGEDYGNANRGVIRYIADVGYLALRNWNSFNHGDE